MALHPFFRRSRPAALASLLAAASLPGLAATPDFAVIKVLVGQATQRTDGTLRLAKDKRGFVQVFLQADIANTALPVVRVQFFLNSAQVYETTIQPPAGLTGVPTVVTDADVAKTWMAVIPASVFQPGLSVQVTADPAQVVPDANRANNVWSLPGTSSLSVVDTHPFRVTFVPLSVRARGKTYVGRIDTTNTDRFLDMFQHVWPVPEAIDRTIHAVFTPSTVPDANYGRYTWETVLNELAALQKAENVTNRYYYGVYNSYYGTNGGTGMAWLGKPQAMGIDWDLLSSPSTFTWRAGTAAHEMGHSLSRPHSPCGGAASPDPAYPYAGATLGTWGYDPWTGRSYNPATNFDLMAYCNYTWVSDYCVDKVTDFRLSGDTTVNGAAAGAKGEACTLVWGRVEDGEVVLNPAFSLQGTPDDVHQEGTYSVELVSARGDVVGSATFEPDATAHGLGRGFALSVPTKGIQLGGVRIKRNGQHLAQRSAGNQDGAHKLDAVRVDAEEVLVTWDAAKYPMVMVKNGQGEVIGFGRDGELHLSTAEDRLEVHLSNGVRSHAVPVKIR